MIETSSDTEAKIKMIENTSNSIINLQTSNWFEMRFKLFEYFLISNIEEENIKHSALLDNLPEISKDLLTNLCLPDQLETKTFDELIEKLDSYYTKHRSTLQARHKFYNTFKESNESLSDWANHVKTLADDCKFGEYAPSAIRDRFIMGINSKTIIDILLLKDHNITLEEALQVAQNTQLNLTPDELTNESFLMKRKRYDIIQAPRCMNIAIVLPHNRKLNNPSQINPQQQPGIRMAMLNTQTNPQQQTSGPTTLTHNQQSVSQANITGQPSNVSAATVPTVQAPVTSQAGAGPAPNQQPMNPQIASRERHTIWHGVLEWIEKAKNPTDQQKLTRHVPCSVSASLKDGEPELKADSWPQKLIMQLMPKQLIGSIGGMYLRNSKSVLFHPQACEALESLTKVMSTGFAGCVHFTSLPSNATCDIKVLILLYTAEKRAYLGFIPNDQAAFVDRLRKVIQQQKSNQQFGRQGQVGTVPGPSGIPNAPGQQMGGQQQIQGNNPTISQPPNSQQGIMMSQTNTMAMGGGQITQNVVTSTSQPNQSGINVMGQQVNPSTMSPRMTLQGMPQQGPTNNQNQQNPNNQGMRPNMMGVQQQRPPFDHLEAARQQNLEKIMQLKQTLEVAQQQEAQYKSQLEIISHMKTQQLQEALQVAQQQEMQFKLQMEMQQQQQRQNLPQSGPQPAANQQRMMRPVTLTNNPGLRHLLQQQPQYRPQLIGMQQMSGTGPRPQQMGQQMQNTGNQSQQFDDSSFDFM